MAPISSIKNNEDLLKRLKELQDMGDFGLGQQVQQPPENSFAAKYGADATVFDVASGKISPKTNNPTFQTMGAQAGSSINPVNSDSNGGSQTFSLSDAIQMDNLPASPTVTAVQTPELPSALTAAGGNEASGKQGGATEDGGSNKGSVGYEASHNALLASLSWTGGEATISDKPSEEVTEPAGEATLTTNSETPETEETPETGGQGNNVNPHDSATETPDDNGDTGTGEGGADGSGNTATEFAIKQDEQQAQRMQEEQQKKIIEEQDKEAA